MGQGPCSSTASRFWRIGRSSSDSSRRARFDRSSAVSSHYSKRRRQMRSSKAIRSLAISFWWRRNCWRRVGQSRPLLDSQANSWNLSEGFSLGPSEEVGREPCVIAEAVKTRSRTRLLHSEAVWCSLSVCRAMKTEIPDDPSALRRGRKASNHASQALQIRQSDSAVASGRFFLSRTAGAPCLKILFAGRV